MGIEEKLQKIWETVQELENKLESIPEQKQSSPKWLRRKDIEEMFSVHTSTVKKWDEDGILKRYKIPGTKGCWYKLEEVVMIPQLVENVKDL